MTEIICISSPIQCLPIRSLLTQLSFRPQNSRQIAALSFLYPLNAKYRGALQQLGCMESAPDAQFLGFATQWRTRYRFTSLALAIAPLVNEEGVTIYHAERMDDPSRLFFSILSHYTCSEAIRLIMGPPKNESAASLAATYIQPEESRLLDILAKNSITVAEQDDLVRYGTACVLTANFWQGKVIYKKLAEFCDLPFAYHCLGMAYSFFGKTGRAEWYYEPSVAKQKDPILKMRGLYSLAVLYLRYHPKWWKDSEKALSYIEKGCAVLEECASRISREDYLYSQVLFDAAKALLVFKRGAFSQALTIINKALAQVKTLPPSSMRSFCMAHGMSNVAQIHRAMGDLDKTAEINKRIVEIDDRLPMWWEEYGKVLLELGRYDEAHQAILRGLEIHYDYPRLHALLGLWSHKMGQAKQSVEAYERACRYDPENKIFQAARNAAHERAAAHTKKAAFSA